jgi:hypothetical protein
LQWDFLCTGREGKGILAIDAALMGWFPFLRAKQRIPRLSKSVLSEKSLAREKTKKKQQTVEDLFVLDYPIYIWLA